MQSVRVGGGGGDVTMCIERDIRDRDGGMEGREEDEVI